MHTAYAAVPATQVAKLENYDIVTNKLKQTSDPKSLMKQIRSIWWKDGAMHAVMSIVSSNKAKYKRLDNILEKTLKSEFDNPLNNSDNALQFYSELVQMSPEEISDFSNEFRMHFDDKNSSVFDEAIRPPQGVTGIPSPEQYQDILNSVPSSITDGRGQRYPLTNSGMVYRQQNDSGLTGHEASALESRFGNLNGNIVLGSRKHLMEVNPLDHIDLNKAIDLIEDNISQAYRDLGYEDPSFGDGQFALGPAGGGERFDEEAQTISDTLKNTMDTLKNLDTSGLFTISEIQDGMRLSPKEFISRVRDLVLSKNPNMDPRFMSDYIYGFLEGHKEDGILRTYVKNETNNAISNLGRGPINESIEKRERFTQKELDRVKQAKEAFEQSEMKRQVNADNESNAELDSLDSQVSSSISKTEYAKIQAGANARKRSLMNEYKEQAAIRRREFLAEQDMITKNNLANYNNEEKLSQGLETSTAEKKLKEHETEVLRELRDLDFVGDKKLGVDALNAIMGSLKEMSPEREMQLRHGYQQIRQIEDILDMHNEGNPPTTLKQRLENVAAAVHKNLCNVQNGERMMVMRQVRKLAEFLQEIINGDKTRSPFPNVVNWQELIHDEKLWEDIMNSMYDIQIGGGDYRTEHTDARTRAVYDIANFIQGTYFKKAAKELESHGIHLPQTKTPYFAQGRHIGVRNGTITQDQFIALTFGKTVNPYGKPLTREDLEKAYTSIKENKKGDGTLRSQEVKLGRAINFESTKDAIIYNRIVNKETPYATIIRGVFEKATQSARMKLSNASDISHNVSYAFLVDKGVLNARGAVESELSPLTDTGSVIRATDPNKRLPRKIVKIAHLLNDMQYRPSELTDSSWVNDIFSLAGNLVFRNTKHGILMATLAAPLKSTVIHGGLPAFGNTIIDLVKMLPGEGRSDILREMAIYSSISLGFTREEMGQTIGATSFEEREDWNGLLNSKEKDYGLQKMVNAIKNRDSGAIKEIAKNTTKKVGKGIAKQAVKTFGKDGRDKVMENLMHATGATLAEKKELASNILRAQRDIGGYLKEKVPFNELPDEMRGEFILNGINADKYAKAVEIYHWDKKASKGGLRSSIIEMYDEVLATDFDMMYLRRSQLLSGQQLEEHPGHAANMVRKTARKLKSKTNLREELSLALPLQGAALTDMSRGLSKGSFAAIKRAMHQLGVTTENALLKNPNMKTIGLGGICVAEEILTNLYKAFVRETISAEAELRAPHYGDVAKKVLTDSHTYVDSITYALLPPLYAASNTAMAAHKGYLHNGLGIGNFLSVIDSGLRSATKPIMDMYKHGVSAEQLGRVYNSPLGAFAVNSIPGLNKYAPLDDNTKVVYLGMLQAGGNALASQVPKLRDTIDKVIRFSSAASGHRPTKGGSSNTRTAINRRRMI